MTWLAVIPAAKPRGSVRFCGPRRINAILAAVGEFAKHSVATGAAPPVMLTARPHGSRGATNSTSL